VGGPLRDPRAEVALGAGRPRRRRPCCRRLY
jgi:hypothetical protein